MKKISFIVYSLLFKTILFVAITLLAWGVGDGIVKLFKVHIENPAGFNNVFTQGKHFDYESSEYAENEVCNTIDEILTYCLKYMKNCNDDNLEEYDRIMRLNNESYKNTVTYLDTLDGVHFAVVNHSTDTVISNLEEINGASPGTEISSFFRSETEKVIIVHNCSNPYFEQDIMTEYVDYIRNKASDYKDNFDLYINFGSDLSFRYEPSHYEALHTETHSYVTKQFNVLFLYLIAGLLLISFYVSISGKSEKNGILLPSITDPIPNEVLFTLIIITAVSSIGLFYNSLYMLYRSSTVESYGLGLSPGFYSFKTIISVIMIVWMLCIFICKFKRQKKLGTLFTNTCIYRFTRLKNESKNTNSN